MARIDNINERRAQRQQQALSPSPLPAAAPGQVAGNSVDNAPAQITYENSGIVPTVTSGRDYRQGAIQAMSEDDFNRNKVQMNASDKEYWSEQARLNPLNTYANLQNYFASGETPVERQRRERREYLGQVFSNLGNLIGNAANLYYTAKGANPVDLNAPVFAENERMRRIKEKRDALKARQDALLAEAKAGDIKNAYNARQAREKAAADAAEKEKGRENELEKLRLKLEADAKKGDADRAEKRRHNQAMEANAARAQDKIVDSVIGADGNIYTRNTPLTDNEAMQLVMSANPTDLSPWTYRGKQIGTDKLRGPIYEEIINWQEAAADLMEDGKIYPEQLISRGFKLGGGMYPDEAKVAQKRAPYRNNNNSKKAPYAR